MLKNLMQVFKYKILFLLFILLTNNGFAQSTPSDTLVYETTDLKPSFIGGRDSLNAFIEEYFNIGDCTVNAIRITLYFTIYMDGSIDHISIKETKNPKCLSDEVIKLMKLTNRHWIPGSIKGKYVNSKFSLPLDISIE